MAIVVNWSMIKLVCMIVKILQNKFDCVIVIEGNRGLGKSTLAYQIARGVATQFKKIQKTKDYLFNPRYALLYTRKEVIRFFHKWRRIGVADEMINVTFNRDFYDSDQKDLIKMINMNRDHCNLFLACVPQFQNLDNQVKNLVKIRITVVRRGIAIIQTPNKSIYSKDKWDQALNEKIERKWMAKGITNPHYSKLTTFRGILKFPKLRAKAEEIYQKVKDDKRNIVAREQMGIEDVDEQDAYDLAIIKLKAGEIRNGSVLDGIAYASEITPETFRRGIANRLKKQGVNHKLSEYYWERKNRSKVAPTEQDDEIAKLINNS